MFLIIRTVPRNVAKATRPFPEGCGLGTRLRVSWKGVRHTGGGDWMDVLYSILHIRTIHNLQYTHALTYIISNEWCRTCIYFAHWLHVYETAAISTDYMRLLPYLQCTQVGASQWLNSPLPLLFTHSIINRKLTNGVGKRTCTFSQKSGIFPHIKEKVDFHWLWSHSPFLVYV